MKKLKREKLEVSGWKVGSTEDFLELSKEEIFLIETKRALMKVLRETRISNRITQIELAKMISSSQSRIAKMESASADVSLDLVFRALYALGVSRAKVAKVLEKGVIEV